jgi:DNA topoisomerase-1
MSQEAAREASEIAADAGLLYVSDQSPGIRRKRQGSHFRFIDPAGKPVRDETTLKRIASLAIPPAWSEVWICPRPDGHLQAVGRDAKGRKQYRYHPRWRETLDRTKYERAIAFGEALPLIRERTHRDLALSGMPREKVLATVVRLLESTLIRIGNREYARTNNSYGLTTLRNRHVDVDGARIRFEFTGKGGKKHSISIRDRRLARVVKQCQELPGQQLFQYLDEAGEKRTVDSADVNAYLREITGEEFTAKDYRTWAATVLAALALREFEAFESDAEAKRNIVQAVELVAHHLGNTASICRKCYIHPDVVEEYLAGALGEAMRQDAEIELVEAVEGLALEEAAVLALLRRRSGRKDRRSSKRRAAVERLVPKIRI